MFSLSFTVYSHCAVNLLRSSMIWILHYWHLLKRSDRSEVTKFHLVQFNDNFKAASSRARRSLLCEALVNCQSHPRDPEGRNVSLQRHFELPTGLGKPDGLNTKDHTRYTSKNGLQFSVHFCEEVPFWNHLRRLARRLWLWAAWTMARLEKNCAMNCFALQNTLTKRK